MLIVPKLLLYASFASATRLSESIAQVQVEFTNRWEVGRKATPRQSTCSEEPAFQLTPTNWYSANTDTQLQNWWTSTTLNATGSKPTQLAAEFGPHLNNFQCGIGLLSTCTAQSCNQFTNDPGDIWAYFAINSIVNLNSFYNELFTGVTNGQVDYVGLTGILAQDFFPWQNPSYPAASVVIWIVASITSVAAFGSLADVGTTIAAGALANFVSAAANQVVQSLTPNLTPTEGIAQLGAFATQAGETTRRSLEQWVNGTFGGQQDVLGHSLKDYIAGGSFVQLSPPSSHEIEEFYKQQMLARTINLAWKISHSKVFIMFANTTDPNDDHGPNETKYYSAKDGGVYYLYSYTDTKNFGGYLTAPPNIDKFNSSMYTLNVIDAVVSSARAWQYASNNYTDQDAQDRIIASVASNGTLTPFQDGSAWEGVWTIPVCNVGNNVDWNTNFGDKKQGYGRLPCCCSPNCTDTAEFARASGWNGSDTLLVGCRRQLAHSGISFASIDYGYSGSGSFAYHWANWNAGQRAGVTIGLILVVLAALCLALLCCSACLKCLI